MSKKGAGYRWRDDETMLFGLSSWGQWSHTRSQSTPASPSPSRCVIHIQLWLSVLDMTTAQNHIKRLSELTSSPTHGQAAKALGKIQWLRWLDWLTEWLTGREQQTPGCESCCLFNPCGLYVSSVGVLRGSWQRDVVVTKSHGTSVDLTATLRRKGALTKTNKRLVSPLKHHLRGDCLRLQREIESRHLPLRRERGPPTLVPALEIVILLLDIKCS